LVWRSALHGLIVLAVFTGGLSACVSYDAKKQIQSTSKDTSAFTGDQLALAITPAQQQQRQALTQRLLSAPLGQKEAVDVFLVNSPALQTLLAQHWAQSASVAQAGRISNPTLAIERIVSGNESEWSGLLSVGLLDILTLPQRADLAKRQLVENQIRLSSDVVDQVTLVRQAWVRAVAANASLSYAQRVAEAAQASDQLAARMLAAGNFNANARSRHQLFYAQSQMQLAMATQAKLSRTEELVRLLGLDASQASQLQLPDRLPELPKATMDTQAVALAAGQQRWDIQMAKAQLETAARAQGLTGISSWLDVELTVISGKVTGNDSVTKRRGAEIGVKLPLFDAGDMRRSQMNAQTLAAVNRLEATAREAASSVRENHAAYLTAYSIARQYRDEVLPLQQRIADENVLRYNAMQISVFDLLSDAASHNAAVVAAIEAQQQFWLSEAALQSTLVGRPLAVVLSADRQNNNSSAAAH